MGFPPPSVPQRPGAIIDLAGTGNSAAGTITLTASPPTGTGITKYSLQLSGVEIQDSITFPHTITGLTAGATYGPYTATATNSGGEGNASNQAYVTLAALAPAGLTFKKRIWWRI